jgi:hypothetical protein
MNGLRVGVVPVPLREGGEDSSDGCKFEAAVAAGGIRVFFVGEASVSSRMRNRFTARRDWDILVWSYADLQPTVTVVDTEVGSGKNSRQTRHKTRHHV